MTSTFEKFGCIFGNFDVNAKFCCIAAAAGEIAVGLWMISPGSSDLVLVGDSGESVLSLLSTEEPIMFSMEKFRDFWGGFSS